MAEYKYVGAVPMSLEGGAPLTPGDTVTLSPEEVEGSYYKTMIDEGMLIFREPVTPEERLAHQQENAPQGDLVKAQQEAEAQQQEEPVANISAETTEEPPPAEEPEEEKPAPKRRTTRKASAKKEE